MELVTYNRNKTLDLRWISEEDFRKIYETVKEKTNNFTEIDERTLVNSPQYLLIIRLVLGMSQLELTKQLGTTNKQWVRDFEAARQNFKYSKLIPRCINIINDHFSDKKILNYEEALRLWKRSQAAREKFFFKPEGTSYNIKKISKMNLDDFKLYLEYLSKETNNFTIWDPNILVNTPQFITIFRIILNLSHRSLAIALNKDPKTVRTHEYKEYKLMPATANEHMELFKRLFEEKNFIGKINIEFCLENFKRISNYDTLEIKIESILNSIKNENISIEKHKEIIINKKTLNIDFVVYINNEPILSIEATKLKKVKRKDIIHRLAYLDHRFQIIKLKYPDINSIIVIMCDNTQEELVKRIIERELINTNFCLINDEIKYLAELI